MTATAQQKSELHHNPEPSGWLVKALRALVRADRWAEGASEGLAIWIARLAPRRVVYWCSVRVALAGTNGFPDRREVRPELTVREALKRWR